MVSPRTPSTAIEMPQVVSDRQATAVGAYFVRVNKGIEMFSSGCQLLDNVLGGGWPLGRISNIVGDRSSGKSLLAIESCTNFHSKWPEAPIHYFEAEAAFDKEYARALGMPIEAVTFPEVAMDDSTVEALYEYLTKVIETHTKNGHPGLIIVDSLDALSDRVELSNEIDAKTYGQTKPKQLSQLFRRLTKRLEETRLHLMIISQIRDNIGVTFGARHTRSGGRALDFYTSQILWLAEKSKIKKTVRKIDRVIGVEIIATCKKNKIGLPFRSCEFPIYFGYGIDDFEANVSFLNECEALDELDTLFTKDKLTQAELSAQIRKLRSTDYTPDQWKALRKRVADVTVKVWETIESGFMPRQTKY